MKRWMIWLGIAVLFLSGAAIGVMGTVMYVHHHIRSIISEGPEAFNRMIMLHLDHELDLTDEQEEAVFGVITETHRRLMPARQPPPPRATRADHDHQHHQGCPAGHQRPVEDVPACPGGTHADTAVPSTDRHASTARDRP